MDAAFEQKVRERAYEMWKAAGQENGLADLHWLSAEQAVMQEHQLKMAAAEMKQALKSAKPVAGKAAAKNGKRKAA